MTCAQQTDLTDILWTDTSVFEARFHKSATAFVAIQQTLRRRLPLGGEEREFLDLCARVTAADPDTFTSVWTDPRAYLWVRVAYELLKSCLNGDEISSLTRRYVSAARCQEPQEALAWHLNQFKLFALAIALRSGEDLTFERPWEPLLPMAIPASPWSLSGPGPVTINGLRNGCLDVSTASGRSVIVPLVETAGFDCDELSRHRCPVIEHDGCQLLAQPHAFHVPTLGAVAEVVGAGVDFQWRHEALVRQTLATVARYAPQSFAQFRDVMSLIALKPRDSGVTFNTSHSQLPGAFIASAVENRLTLADDFVHEFYHNRLFAIEERGPFFDEQTGQAFTEAKYYSPWRFDLRPLHGVLHALYVFSQVGRYWLHVYQDEDIAPEHRQYATDRLLRIPLQLSQAAHVLARHASFTPFGQAIFEGIVGELDRLHDDVAGLDLPEDAPALTFQLNGSYAPQVSEIDGRPLSVRAAVDEHRQLYDLESNCADMPLPIARDRVG